MNAIHWAEYLHNATNRIAALQQAQDRAVRWAGQVEGTAELLRACALVREAQILSAQG
jgi:hypothetical protein